MHSVLEQRKQWQKQYISVGKTDLFYNSMGLCGNFTFLSNHWSELSRWVCVRFCISIYRIFLTVLYFKPTRDRARSSDLNTPITKRSLSKHKLRKFVLKWNNSIGLMFLSISRQAPITRIFCRNIHLINISRRAEAKTLRFYVAIKFGYFVNRLTFRKERLRLPRGLKEPFSRKMHVIGLEEA